jgi:hypothetical protein
MFSAIQKPTTNTVNASEESDDSSFGGFRPEMFGLGACSETKRVMGRRGRS